MISQWTKCKERKPQLIFYITSLLLNLVKPLNLKRGYNSKSHIVNDKNGFLLWKTFWTHNIIDQSVAFSHFMANVNGELKYWEKHNQYDLLHLKTQAGVHSLKWNIKLTDFRALTLSDNCPVKCSLSSSMWLVCWYRPPYWLESVVKRMQRWRQIAET